MIFFLIIFLIYSLFLSIVKSDVDDLFTVELSDTIQYYYLETSNVNTASGNSEFLHTSQSALGIWDTTTGIKQSIQFIPNNYTGTLIPTLTSDGRIIWYNSGNIVITSPIVEDEWSTSTFIGISSGGSYNDLKNFITGDPVDYQYQPVEVIYPDITALEQNYSKNPLNPIDLGIIVIAPNNSYAFVNSLMKQLNAYGCVLESFTKIDETSFVYLSDRPKINGFVEWKDNHQANIEVYNWYKDLNECFDDVQQHNTIPINSEIYKAIANCYFNSSVAYIYRSSNSVYNISLIDSSVFQTPIGVISAFKLPSAAAVVEGAFSIIDYLIILVIFACLLWMFFYFFSKLMGYNNIFGDNRRAKRRIEFAGNILLIYKFSLYIIIILIDVIYYKF
jgi:hypothetical protein